MVVAVLLVGIPAQARRIRQVPDSLASFLADSLKARRDSLQRADSLASAQRDSLDMLSKSSLEVPAFTTAKDSIITDFSNGKRTVYYYGGATVTYQNMKLSADYLEYDMLTNIVYARGQKDIATGEMKGLPEMTEGGQTYKMDELYYNFNTRKARITNMVTKEAEGLLQGKKIKMAPDNSISLKDGVYTISKRPVIVAANAQTIQSGERIDTGIVITNFENALAAQLFPGHPKRLLLQSVLERPFHALVDHHLELQPGGRRVSPQNELDCTGEQV